VLDAVGALDYHRLTEHRPGHRLADDPRIVRSFRPMAWEHRPPPFKAYPGREIVPLPADLAADRLGRLLFLSAGVVRRMDALGGTLWFRAAGSAGNLAPVEVYVVDAAGVFHYQPRDHALVRIGEGVPGTGRALVLTGVAWRTCWKYRERGFRHLWWDAGTMLAQVLELEPEARVQLGFVDDAVAALVGARAPGEIPLAVVPLDGTPLDLAGRRRLPAARGELGPPATVFPLVTAAAAAGALAAPAAVEGWRAAGAAACHPAPTTGHRLGTPIEDVIRRRGSTRQFAPGRPAPAELLTGALPWAARQVPWDLGEGTLLGHDVLVHDVEGFEPGGYRLGPEGTRLLAAGDVRGAGRHLCLDQDLGGDGAFTVFSGAELEPVVTALGDRGYRAAQLESGIVAGRLHLAAYGCGLGATGLTFFDEGVRRFFDTQASPMLVTAVGAPAYRSRPGGLPGRPVVMVGR